MVKLLKQNYKVEIFYIYNDLEQCFLYTKKRESVTNRVVPEDVFFNSVIKSRSTTSEVTTSGRAGGLLMGTTQSGLIA